MYVFQCLSEINLCYSKFLTLSQRKKLLFLSHICGKKSNGQWLKLRRKSKRERKSIVKILQKFFKCYTKLLIFFFFLFACKYRVMNKNINTSNAILLLFVTIKLSIIVKKWRKIIYNYAYKILQIYNFRDYQLNIHVK